MLTAEQVSARRAFIGGSDAAAVLGLSRWRSPLDVWSEKTGVLAAPDLSKKLHIRLGDRLEQVVAELFEEESGYKVRRVKDSFVHPIHPFLSAQVDRIVEKTDDVLECKTASGFKAKEWEDDDVPPEYIIQCLHQLMVTGKARAHIACLIGGNQDFVWKVIERNDEMIGEIERKEVEFWTKYVVPRIMPGVSAIDAPTLLGLFPFGAPPSNEAPKVLPNVAVDKIATLAGIDAVLKENNERRETLRNEIKAMLGDARIGTAGEFKITWSDQKGSEYTVKREPTRVLRISKIGAKAPKGGK